MTVKQVQAADMALPDTSDCVANFNITVNYSFIEINQEFEWSPLAFAKLVREKIKEFDQETIFKVAFDGVYSSTKCIEEAMLALGTMVDPEKGI